MQPTKPKRRWKRYVGIMLILLLAFGLYRAVRPDPNLKKVKQLQAEFASAESKNWTSEQRQEKGREMRTAMGKLSESQRQALGDERRREFENELRRYAAMAPAEKVRHLDEQINRSEQFRQRMAQQNAGGARPNTFEAGPGGGGGAGGTRGSSSAEDREKRRKERLDRTTPEFRALTDQYRKDMENRRRQRGMSTGGR